MNPITDFLNLEDIDLRIVETRIEESQKIILLETEPSIHHCPLCGFRMHSKGIYTRTINHPILQDTYELVLKVKQRRWRCTNDTCRYEVNDSFHFVNPNRRNTNTTDLLIVNAFKDLYASAASIARQFDVSDTYALDVFNRYVKMDRLPFSDIICIDEVHVDLDDYCKYALVIQDFYTGEPIDILRSRRANVTEPYFANIPKEERFAVKYLISDMYNPYIQFVDKYFPNALHVVDSFHVIQWMIHSIEMYIRKMVKNYKQRDRVMFLAKHPHLDSKDPRLEIPLSDEVYLLQKYRWLVLANQSNITYYSQPRMDRHFNCLMNTYDYEDRLFRIDRSLKQLRDLKEEYIRFNTRYAGHPLEAVDGLHEVISRYQQSGNPIFMEFSELLQRHFQSIINSFVMVEKHGDGKLYSSRLSNGPMESLNRKAKDLKRMGRGYQNFEHFRTRFLYATRDNPTINAITRYNPVHYYSEDDDD